MKKIIFKALVLSACFCLLCGCSGGPQDGSASASESQSTIQSEIQPEIPAMTEAELNQYFQQAFDAKGNGLDTPEQLALELEEVNALAVNAALPEDYEAQYQEWRKGYIESLLKTLQGEYDKIVSEMPLYDGVNPGAAFADLVDFEGDGIKELVILNVRWEHSSWVEESEIFCSIEVYGENLGHASQYGTIPGPTMHYREMDDRSISFVQNGGKIYLHSRDTQGQNMEDYYYTVEKKSILTADKTYADSTSCSSFDKEITVEEYKAIHAKYDKGITLIDHRSMISILPVQNRGILPEISQDVQRRAAFVNVLSSNSFVYAKLIDVDRDGSEDLVVLREVKTQNYGDIRYFRTYSWNGAELVAVDLDHVSDPMITDHLRMGFHDYSIQQKKSTGDIYFVYSGEIAGGWGGTLFVNAKGYEFYGEPFYPSDGDISGWTDADFAEYEAASAAYQNGLNSYSLIEDCGTLWKHDLTYTVDDVMQQLMGV